jgi:hypothetical protein
VRIGLDGSEIIDRDDLDIVPPMLEDRTQYIPANPAKSVDGYTNRHIVFSIPANFEAESLVFITPGFSWLHRRRPARQGREATIWRTESQDSGKFPRRQPVWQAKPTRFSALKLLYTNALKPPVERAIRQRVSPGSSNRLIPSPREIRTSI